MKAFLMLSVMGMFITGAALADEKIYATDKYGRQREQVLVVKGNNVYATDKYGRQEEQRFVIKGDKVYATDKYGRQQEQVNSIKPK